jgi:hypothetical protein
MDIPSVKGLMAFWLFWLINKMGIELWGRVI